MVPDAGPGAPPAGPPAQTPTTDPDTATFTNEEISATFEVASEVSEFNTALAGPKRGWSIGWAGKPYPDGTILITAPDGTKWYIMRGIADPKNSVTVETVKPDGTSTTVMATPTKEPKLPQPPIDPATGKPAVPPKPFQLPPELIPPPKKPS